jgi:GT2 family glycosyltransferase
LTVTAGEDPVAGPQVTVVFLLYNAAGNVDELVARLAVQRHPRLATQAAWLRALFIDDASSDDTVPRLRRRLAELESPLHYRLVENETNLGLARSLNRALGMVETPYVLTCHCDCLFADDRFVARALQLLEDNPKAAAIGGQARLMPGRRPPFAELLNTVTNLMDVVPESAEARLVPLGFAEGRCDAFRTVALRTVGLYDTALRTAGEDQLLAARLRAAGYELYKATDLEYYLMVSEEQNTIRKLLRHQRLFGRMHPFIIFGRKGTLAGFVGQRASANRRARARLRVSQLVAVPLYPLAATALVPGGPGWPWLLPLVATLVARSLIFLPVLRATRPAPWQLAAILALQPLLDFAYAIGFGEGTLHLLRRHPPAQLS